MKKNNTNTSRNQRNLRYVQVVREDRLGHVRGGGDTAPSPDAQHKESPDAQRKE